ncbi:MAG TPA: MBL fold metallo-hydrolase [Bacteroidetes bacterium]|nr:MBL fold metallo-hydrolase [Bacteroidota bacterium]
MKTTWLMFLFAWMQSGLFAQDYQKDVIATSSGDLEITFIAHGTLMMQYQGRVIHIDPVSMFGTDYAKMPDADLILITHAHGDHLDPDAIARIRTDKTMTILTNQCFERLGFGQVMANGDQKTVFGIRIEAVPAYNLKSAYHPKGVGNGYVLHFGDKKVYVAGDTENIPEMSDLKDIDVAFLPMNRPYTMTPEMVAEAARRFRPKILYPYHYGDTDTGKLVELLKDEEDIEVRIRKM